MLRNRTVDICRKAKKEYLENKLDKSKNKPKQIWKVLKEILKGSKKSTEYKELKYDCKIIQNIEQMADIFSNYFIDSVEQFRKNDTEETSSGRIIYTYTNNIFEEFEQIEEKSLKSTVKRLLKKNQE